MRKKSAEGGLESVIEPISASVVRDRVAKTARVVFQVSPAEKREIQATASGFSMSMSEYLVQVHRLFRKLSGGKMPKRAKDRGNVN